MNGEEDGARTMSWKPRKEVKTRNEMREGGGGAVVHTPAYTDRRLCAPPGFFSLFCTLTPRQTGIWKLERGLGEAHRRCS